MRRERGFTQMELLMAMALLGIIVAITLARLPRGTVRGLDVEGAANQIASGLRIAAQLSQTYTQRYDVEFYDANLGTTTPYRKYKIKNFDTGEYYRSQTYEISSNVNCAPLGSGASAVQTVSFYTEGYARLLTSSGSVIADTSKNGFLCVSGRGESMSFSKVFVVIQTAAVTVQTERAGQQI